MSGNATLDMMAKSKQIQNKKIFQRAILNAKIHGISLVPGRENQGDGNCSYESVIFNINDRSCFAENLSMSPDYYRRIWNIDMMNKIIVKTPTPTQPNTTGWFDTKITVQTTPPTHPPPTQTFQPLLDQLES